MKYQARNQKFTRVGEFSSNLGTSINISSKTQEKKAPQWKILEFFSLRYPENYILNGKFNTKMDTIRTFPPKSGHFFWFSKKGRTGLLLCPPLVARLNPTVKTSSMYKNISFLVVKCVQHLIKSNILQFNLHSLNKI